MALSVTPFATTFALVLVALACSTGPTQSNNGTGGSTSCPAGSETCPCKSDKTCDEGLDCRSNLCVAAASSGGASNSGGAASSSGGKGGSSNSGGSETGGTTSTSGGAQSSGGSGGAAVETGGAPASGGDGAGGAAQCTADTQTDPENCGSCGRECKVHEILGQCNSCCTQGSCSDSFGDCIRESDGFTTCADYCNSVGEECVQQGCGMNTYRAWSAPDTCGQFAAAIGGNDEPCDTLIEFGSYSIRCCCTDHAP